MNKYEITTNKRTVEWIGMTGAIARDEFYKEEIAPKKKRGPYL